MTGQGDGLPRRGFATPRNDTLPSFPPSRGKAIYILKYSNLIQPNVLKNALSYPCLSPHTLLDTEGHAG